MIICLWSANHPFFHNEEWKEGKELSPLMKVQISNRVNLSNLLLFILIYFMFRACKISNTRQMRTRPKIWPKITKRMETLILSAKSTGRKVKISVCINFTVVKYEICVYLFFMLGSQLPATLKGWKLVDLMGQWTHSSTQTGPLHSSILETTG